MAKRSGEIDILLCVTQTILGELESVVEILLPKVCQEARACQEETSTLVELKPMAGEELIKPRPEKNRFREIQ